MEKVAINSNKQDSEKEKFLECIKNHIVMNPDNDDELLIETSEVFLEINLLK